MEAPRLAGFTKDQREYEVSASAASQDTRNPQFVEMKEISGRMAMQDKSTVTMTAVEGVYDTKADLLTLVAGDRDRLDRGLSGPAFRGQGRDQEGPHSFGKAGAVENAAGHARCEPDGSP